MRRLPFAALALLVGLAGCTSSPEHEPVALEQPGLELVGEWQVTPSDEQQGEAVIAISSDGLRVESRCGSSSGWWRADGTSFLADPSLSATCLSDVGPGIPSPDLLWLYEASSFAFAGEDVVLIDVGGDVVATMVRSSDFVPTTTVADGPAVVDSAPLPRGVADVMDITGRWQPDDEAGGGAAFIQFGEAGFYQASDGCNGFQGRWAVAPGSAFLGSTGIHSQLACDNWDGADWVSSAARVGMLDDNLVFYDADGKLLGTMLPA